jgi:hypothetical protein
MTTYNKRKENNSLQQTSNAVVCYSYRALLYMEYINQRMRLTECNKMCRVIQNDGLKFVRL